MTKLTDLEPRYFVNTLGGHPVGITFDCPHCMGSGQRLAIAIHLDGTNMDPDPNNPQQFATDERVWSITGGDNRMRPGIEPPAALKENGNG